VNEEDSYSSLIFHIYLALNDCWGFFQAYVFELVTDELLESDAYHQAQNIQGNLMSLAATKIYPEPSKALAPKFQSFKSRIQIEYETWLKAVQAFAFRNGIPLRADLTDLVTKSDDDLREDAERESFGLNAARIHTDIYTNELLEGMRIIHQALSAIMTKLDIKFEIDWSHINKRSSHILPGSDAIREE
jgi:hypothetical protein